MGAWMWEWWFACRLGEQGFVLLAKDGSNNRSWSGGDVTPHFSFFIQLNGFFIGHLSARNALLICLYQVSGLFKPGHWDGRRSITGFS